MQISPVYEAKRLKTIVLN